MKTIALILAVLMALPAHAADCLVPYAPRKIVRKYSAPVVHHDYAAPVVLKQITPHYYYGVGAYLQEAALVAAVKADLKAEQQQALATQQAELKQMIRDLVQELKQPAPTTEPAPTDSAGTAAAIGKAVLEAKCAMCHRPDSADLVVEAGPTLFRDDGTVMDWTPQQKQRIYDLAHSGSMPKEPLPPLSDDEFLAVASYLKIEPRKESPQ